MARGYILLLIVCSSTVVSSINHLSHDITIINSSLCIWGRVLYSTYIYTVHICTSYTTIDDATGGRQRDCERQCAREGGRPGRPHQQHARECERGVRAAAVGHRPARVRFDAHITPAARLTDVCYYSLFMLRAMLRVCSILVIFYTSYECRRLEIHISDLIQPFQSIYIDSINLWF